MDDQTFKVIDTVDLEQASAAYVAVLDQHMDRLANQWHLLAEKRRSIAAAAGIDRPAPDAPEFAKLRMSIARAEYEGEAPAQPMAQAPATVRRSAS
jgi:hypothetical protein